MRRGSDSHAEPEKVDHGPRALMKLPFDANQQYHLDAIAAVTDLFDG